ncbi:MAG: helix-turn-helix transcriptional regulator [Firmicutes bacterium]|nr:helix-turn-helix transcriptional regulator [Bacillota bacterium]
MTFEQKLQTLRKENGYSQEELAEKLGVSRQAVSKWETGLSYPETEKLIALSKLFDVSLDEFLKEMPKANPAEMNKNIEGNNSSEKNSAFNNPYKEEPRTQNSFVSIEQKPNLLKKVIIALCAAVLILPLAMFLFGYATSYEITDGQHTAPYNTVFEIKTITVPEIKTVTVAETITVPQTVTVTETVTVYEEAEATAPTEPEAVEYILPQGQELALWVFDFAQRWRLDYMPYFEQGKAPTESPEYLFWAFAINLDNWGEDKGRMSKEYVGDVVLQHFGVPALSHLSMWKGWDYENGLYTAYPGGLKELPLYALREFKTYYGEYGQPVYEVIVDSYSLADGYIPSAENIESFRTHIIAPNEKDWRCDGSERLVFTFSGYFEKPLFLEHTYITAD